MSKNKSKKQIEALLSSSDSDSSEVQITKKVVKKDKNAKRKVSVASESSASVNLLKNKRKQSVEKKKAPKKVVKKVDSDDESDSSSEVVVSKKNNKNKKVSKKVEEESSSDESEEEVKKPVKVKETRKQSKASSKNKKKVESSSEEEKDSDSESEVVVKNKKGGKKEEVEEEEEEGCKEIFVKNLPYTANDDGMYEHFGQFGTVVNVKICKDKMTGKSRGFGFVEFEKRSECKKVISEPGEIDGRGYLCSFSDEKDKLNGQRGPSGQGGNQERKSFGGHSGDVHTVFVGNLKFRIREDSIRKFFQSCGNIVGIRIAKDMEGKEKGFGHVDFDSKEACDAAVALAGGEIEGRECRVDHAAQRRNDGGSGGRGGFGGRGGRGGDRGGRGGFGGRGGRGGFGGGFDKPRHGPMGGNNNKKTFNNDSDSD